MNDSGPEPPFNVQLSTEGIAMLQDAIEIREVNSQDGFSKSFEVYDSDTGTSLGNYESLERAEAEKKNMNSSNATAKNGEADIDPST